MELKMRKKEHVFGAFAHIGLILSAVWRQAFCLTLTMQCVKINNNAKG